MLPTLDIPGNATENTQQWSFALTNVCLVVQMGVEQNSNMQIEFYSGDGL